MPRVQTESTACWLEEQMSWKRSKRVLLLLDTGVTGHSSGMCSSDRHTLLLVLRDEKQGANDEFTDSYRLYGNAVSFGRLDTGRSALRQRANGHARKPKTK